MEKITNTRYIKRIIILTGCFILFFTHFSVQAQHYTPTKQLQLQSITKKTISQTESPKHFISLKSDTADLFFNQLNFALILALVFVSTMWYSTSKAYQMQINSFKISKEREKKQKVIEEKLLEQEFKSLSLMIREQKEERKKIAQDLHDRIGCLLSLVRMNFHAINKHIEGVRIEDQQRYYQAYELLEKACDEVRNIAHDMISGVLKKFGLFTALENLKLIIEASTPLQINFNYSGFEENGLDTTLEITTFRMIQELTTNIVKHANAKEAEIQVIKNKKNLNITIEDDGQGFNLKIKDLGRIEGSGLKNIYTRVQELGGELNIDSYIDKGTTIIIDIPLA